MRHEKVKILNQLGIECDAVAPIIISASRATDIPAFYSDWFFYRLDCGYVKWLNPYNWKYSYVSFGATRFVVLWSKNPAPMIPKLRRLKEMGIKFYLQYTLNDYDKEGLEPGVPILSERIDTLKRIVDSYGTGSVVWRFDPLMLTDQISTDSLIDKIGRIADVVSGYVNRLVFSYSDISEYRNVARNMNSLGVKYREWTTDEMNRFASILSKENEANWHLHLSTCAETINLDKYGINHNRCIDPSLILQRSPHDSVLHSFLDKATTDGGQRKACGCILAKDIGAYNTCPHFCKYCYANYSQKRVLENFNKRRKNTESESLI